MNKIYNFKNGTIYVTLPETCNREKLKKATEEFLKGAIKGRKNNGYSNTSRDFRKE